MRGMRLEKNLVTFPGTEGDKGLWTWEDRVQYTELQAVPQVGDDVSVLFQKTVQPDSSIITPKRKKEIIKGLLEMQKLLKQVPSILCMRKKLINHS